MAETRFEGRSPVARYWLSKCEGFAVTGGERGVVEELIRGDADPFVTTRLVVRTGRRRRAVVPAEAVAAVDPAERVVFVVRRRRKQHTRIAMTRAAASARRGSEGTARRLAYARQEMTTRAAPAVESAGRTTMRVAAVTAASTRRHAPRFGAYVRSQVEPVAAVVARSFSLLLTELTATAHMATALCLKAGRRVRRQLTDGSSGMRDTSS
jgi:hypothetical protein